MIATKCTCDTGQQHVYVQYMVMYQLLVGIAGNVIFYMDGAKFSYAQVRIHLPQHTQQMLQIATVNANANAGSVLPRSVEGVFKSHSICFSRTICWHLSCLKAGCRNTCCADVMTSCHFRSVSDILNVCLACLMLVCETSHSSPSCKPVRHIGQFIAICLRNHPQLDQK